MNLYIVRHGETTWNSEDRIQGHSDPGLSRKGLSQARLLARRFGSMRLDRIYASPLQRALETARFIATAAGKKIIMREGLKEVMLGDWEGMTTAEVDRAYRGSYRRWLKKGPTNVPIPHAEKITSFRRRIERAFAAIVRENAGTDKNILVVTHGGVIAAYLAHVLDADFNRVLLGLHLPNTCVTLVSFKKEKRSLIHVADTLHLSDDRPPVD